MKSSTLLLIIGLIFIFIMDENTAGYILILISLFFCDDKKTKDSSRNDSTNVGKKSE